MRPFPRAVRTVAALVGLTAALVVAVPVQSASAASYGAFPKGRCLPAAGTAYQQWLKISVTELQTGQSTRDATAYMTMSVVFCSDGNSITWASIFAADGGPTSLGLASGLQKRSFERLPPQPPAYVGGPYTLETRAVWGRNIEVGGGPAKYSFADFSSSLTVRMYPDTDPEGRGPSTLPGIECAGTSNGSPEPCELNLASAPRGTETAELCTPDSRSVSYYPHSPDNGQTINYWKTFYDGRVGDKRVVRFIMFNWDTGQYDLDKGTNSTMCPTPPPPPGQPNPPPPPGPPPGQGPTGTAALCWSDTVTNVEEWPDGSVHYERLTFDSQYGETWYGATIRHFLYKESFWNGTNWYDGFRRPLDVSCGSDVDGPSYWPYIWPPNLPPMPRP